MEREEEARRSYGGQGKQLRANAIGAESSARGVRRPPELPVLLEQVRQCINSEPAPGWWSSKRSYANFCASRHTDKRKGVGVFRSGRAWYMLGDDGKKAPLAWSCRKGASESGCMSICQETSRECGLL